MLRVTLAQMRRSVGRLAAAGIAIVIGTAFVAATLLAGNVITRTTYDAIAARFADADLIVGVDSRSGAELLTPGDADAVSELEGVDAVGPVQLSMQALTRGARTIYQAMVPTTADPRLMPLVVDEGELPTGTGQIALPADVADRFGVDVGGTISVDRLVLTEDDSWEPVVEQLDVVGIVDDPYGAFAMMGGAAVVSADDYDSWQAAEGVTPAYDELSVLLADGADADAVADAIGTAVGDGRVVETPDERAASTAASLTGGQDLMFMIFVLTFAAIALLVAGLVIANTFQVLVAQRTRMLALLRCVGADKGQIGRGVLAEAAILGVIASITGVVVGAALGQTALWVAHQQDLSVPLPTTISLTWQIVVIPLIVGTLVTVAAALVPARVATRVAPLAALRPADAPTTSKGSAGRVRLVLSVLATVFGFAMLGGGAAMGMFAGDPTIGLLLGVAGGALSFVGVAVGAVYWLPRVAALAGRLVGSSGPTARLAAANTLRNPRRTAATSTALLIGVTLVAMMSTGAESARASLTTALDTRYPVDVWISSEQLDENGGTAALSPQVREAVGSVDGVGAVAEVTGIEAEAQGDFPMHVSSVDVQDAAAALRYPEGIERLAPGTVILPSGTANAVGVSDGETLTVTGPDGSAALEVAVTSLEIGDPLVTPQDMAALADHPVLDRMWLALDEADAAGSVVPRIQDAVADIGESIGVSGAAVERANFEQVIDTALGIVVGLLAVAVVIALIGVANTLSLSVIERRRESATLRAIGLTRGQLRGMLAIEGVLIAGVGAVLGIVLGLLYGWAGAAAALGVMGDVLIVVPWRDVALVLAVAIVAGLVASVVPGRAAARTSPVAALAVE